MNGKLKSRGFSLVEVLVGISILAVLAALLFPALGSSTTKASSATSSSNLRQIGLAINSYAIDNGGMMPGPMNSGHGPNFPASSSNPYHLGHHLWDYLQASQTSSSQAYCEVLEYPAWSAETGGSGISYYFRREVRKNGQRLYPMGRRVSNPNNNNAPMRLAAINVLNLNDEVMIYEVDQQSPIGSPGWKSGTPSEPLHGNYRNALLYNGSVEAIPVDEVERFDQFIEVD